MRGRWASGPVRTTGSRTWSPRVCPSARTRPAMLLRRRARHRSEARSFFTIFREFHRIWFRNSQNLALPMHDRGRVDDDQAGGGLLTSWTCNVTATSGIALQAQVRQQRPVQPHLDPAIREDLRRGLRQHRRRRDDRQPVPPARGLAPSRRAGARRRQRDRRRGVPPGPDLRRQGDRDRPRRGDGRHRARRAKRARHRRRGRLHPGRRPRDRPSPRSSTSSGAATP